MRFDGKGRDMGFILGFMAGMLAACALLGIGVWWVCSRSNNMALAKFINGIAQALAHKARPPEPMTPSKNGMLPEDVSKTAGL
jgi:hypothetical protein